MLSAQNVEIELVIQTRGREHIRGVLDALLSHEDIDLRALSGASAGAMNAVVLAHGLAHGGREGARTSLRVFWHALGTRLPFGFGWMHWWAPSWHATMHRLQPMQASASILASTDLS